VRCGPCAGVKCVTFYPLPGMFEDGPLAVVRVKWERFLVRLSGRR
jgi:hypothetical protein